MISIIATAMLVCHWPPELVNIDLKDHVHMSVLKTAAKRCVHWHPESPCLVRLVRTPETIDFSATCGEAKLSAPKG